MGSASAPDLASRLRAEYAGNQIGLVPDQSEVHGYHDDYHQGLEKLLTVLDKQSKKKKAAEQRRLQTEAAEVETQRAHQLFLQGSRMEKQKAAWTYTDAPGFFEYPQRYEQGESKVCSQNKLLSGIYDVTHPDFKPPHAEYGGWKTVHPEMSPDGMALFL